MKFYYPEKANPEYVVELPDAVGLMDVGYTRLQSMNTAFDGTMRGVDYGICVALYRLKLLLTPGEWEDFKHFILSVVKLQIYDFDWETPDGSVKRVRYGDKTLKKKIIAPKLVAVEFTLRERMT